MFRYKYQQPPPYFISIFHRSMARKKIKGNTNIRSDKKAPSSTNASKSRTIPTPSKVSPRRPSTIVRPGSPTYAAVARRNIRVQSDSSVSSVESSLRSSLTSSTPAKRKAIPVTKTGKKSVKKKTSIKKPPVESIDTVVEDIHVVTKDAAHKKPSEQDSIESTENYKQSESKDIRSILSNLKAQIAELEKNPQIPSIPRNHLITIRSKLWCMIRKRNPVMPSSQLNHMLIVLNQSIQNMHP